MYIDTLVSDIKAWIDRADLSDTLIKSWVTDAEDRFNRVLRVKEMINREYSELQSGEIVLPAGCLEVNYIKFRPTGADTNETVAKGTPLTYISNDEYFSIVGDPNNPKYYHPFFSYVGSKLLVNPAIITAGTTNVEVSFYETIPPLGSADNLIYPKYQRMYKFASIGAGSMYLTEDDRMPSWEALARTLIGEANAEWEKAKSSGSPLRPRFKTFG